MSIDEKTRSSKLKNLKNQYKMAEEQNLKQIINEQLVEFTTENPNFRSENAAVYSTAGDKYRLTLINISGVQGWFEPNSLPRPSKKMGILLVPSNCHCKLEDIDEQGRWTRDWHHKCSDGSEKHYTKGEWANNMLAGWRAARDNFEREWDGEVRVWGQPRAWTDELISTWVIEHIKLEWGQAICQVDCLASQWSKPCLVKAWDEGILWCPLAPDVTSYLQEPDTHEHSQLKAIIREKKTELHFALEQQFLSENKNETYVPKWGPYEVLNIIGESLKEFKIKHPRVPLQGLIRNNMLICKPNAEGKLEITSDTAEGFEPKFPPSRGIPPQAALDRMQLCKDWIEAGTRAPKPNWDALDRDFRFEAQNLDEPEDEDSELMLDFATEKLELTEHQKAMLSPPENRIKQIQYPAAIKRRAHFISKFRKNRWAAKFKSHFLGKAAVAWREKIAKHGKNKFHESVAATAKTKFKALPKTKARRSFKAAVEEPETLSEAIEEDKKETRKRGRKTQTREKLDEHEFLKKQVRVVGECAEEGRCGEVTEISKATSTDEHYTCHIISENGVFSVRVEYLELVDSHKAFSEPAPFKIDLRTFKAPQRRALKHSLESSNDSLEKVVRNQTLEQSTMAAIVAEIEMRLRPEDTVIVIPSISTVWCKDKVEEDIGGEVSTTRAKYHTSKHLFALIWSEPPMHYTMLYVRGPSEEQPRYIEFKDSLKGGSEAARRAATNFLRNIEAIGPEEQAPLPCNEQFQVDGWSCGLWSCRWIERQIRENSGEARLPMTSLGDLITRTNHFIETVKAAEAHKYTAKAKAKGASKSSSLMIEPIHETFESALAAAFFV